MPTWKTAIYILTATVAFLFAVMESRERNKLTDATLLSHPQNVREFGLAGDFRQSLLRDRILNTLPLSSLLFYRAYGVLKYACMAALAVEAIVLAG